LIQNKILKRIFGQKREIVTKDLKKLHERHNLYSSSNITPPKSKSKGKVAAVLN
jgi:hypothetical protein